MWSMSEKEANLIKRHARLATKLVKCPCRGWPLVITNDDDDKVLCDCELANPALNDAYQEKERSGKIHFVRFLERW